MDSNLHGVNFDLLVRLYIMVFSLFLVQQTSQVYNF